MNRTIRLVVILCLVLTATALDAYIEDADRFPGWRGELPSSLHLEVQDSVGYGELGKVSGRSRIHTSGTFGSLCHH